MLLLFPLSLVWSGCELLGDDPTPGVRDVDIIYYETHIQPIFDNRCTSCHNNRQPPAGLDMQDWNWLIQGSDFGEALIAYAPDDSRMIRMLDRDEGESHLENVGKARLSTDEIDLLKRWIDEGARGPLGTSPFASSLNLVYVVHETEPFISIVDSDARLVVRRIDLTEYGFSKRARAHHIAVEPDGSYWYASIGGRGSADDQAVVKFTRENRLVGRFAMDSPGLIALHPTEDVLFASREVLSNSVSRSLIEIRRSDMSGVDIDVTFDMAHALAIRPQADYLISSSMDVDQMILVDMDSREVHFYDITGVERSFRQFAISPNGNRMWGTGVLSGTVTLFGISNPEGIVQRLSLNVGSDPQYLTYLPDASKVYVTIRGSDKVVVLNAFLDTIDKEITHPALVEPIGVATTKDGKFLFVSSNNSSGRYKSRHAFFGDEPPGIILVIDTATDEVVKVIEMSPAPAAISSRVVVPLTTR